MCYTRAREGLISFLDTKDNIASLELNHTLAAVLQLLGKWLLRLYIKMPADLILAASQQAFNGVVIHDARHIVCGDIVYKFKILFPSVVRKQRPCRCRDSQF